MVSFSTTGVQHQTRGKNSKKDSDVLASPIQPVREWRKKCSMAGRESWARERLIKARRGSHRKGDGGVSDRQKGENAGAGQTSAWRENWGLPCTIFARQGPSKADPSS
ncbi:hypothetical protein HRR86_008271 [Exophiala dermatitidis]|nr:hypothetical protein HRR85_007825 [Exophiala dermatitidis]KAJ4614472.1 hypothetical protein HRR86_008271 [Exophiala dermatitidis]KAJ4664785.1 hypothetical protein HRR93_007938 [Exophiala dermatitidis]